MKVVDFCSPGGPDVLYVREVPEPVIKDDEVLIKIAAVGVCVEDIWRRTGDYVLGANMSPYLGHECSGKVIAIGSKVSRFKIGDKVCAYLRDGGGYAEFVKVPAMHVALIPSRLSLVDAAALPQATCLTIYILTVLQNISRGKKILIHGATGGVGTIALQYARHLGCDVFAVSGATKKLEICKTLGAKVCINYKEENFYKRTMTATEGKGVDIIIDVNGRDHLRKNLDCLAIHGTLTLLGIGGGYKTEVDLSLLGKKDLKIMGASLINLPLKEVEELLLEAETWFWPLINDGHIKPIITGIFSFSNAADAHRAKEKHSGAGRVLLVPGDVQHKAKESGEPQKQHKTIDNGNSCW